MQWRANVGSETKLVPLNSTSYQIRTPCLFVFVAHGNPFDAIIHHVKHVPVPCQMNNRLPPKPNPRSSSYLRLTLVLGGTRLGELEGDGAAGQAAVDLGVGVESVVDTTTLLLVEDDLEELAAILLGADALADNLDGVDEVGEDGIVDGGQGSRTRALLLEGVARAGGSLGAGQNAARGEDQDMAVGELLLELTSQALLDSVEAL